MVADYFTKPLQGALFRKLRSILMGWTHPSSLYKISSSSDEERVVKDTILAASDKK